MVSNVETGHVNETVETAIAKKSLQMVHETISLDQSDHQTCLESFDQRLALLDKVHQAYLSEMSNERKTRNSITPIAKLPVELLIQIFHEVAEEGMGGPIHYYKRLLRVSSTCHRWHALSVATPTLWNRISHGLPQSLLLLTLERNGRSQGAGLRVDIGRLGRKTSLGDFLDIILPFHERWTSLYIADRFPVHETQLLQELWSLAYPRLQSINIDEAYGILDLPAADVLSDTLVLRSVRLERVGDVRSDRNVFRGLTSLHLKDLKLREDTSCGNPLLSILHNCPELQILHVDGVRHQWSPGAMEATSKLVELPHLMSLTVRRQGPTEAQALVDGINAPQCEAIYGDIPPGEGLLRLCRRLRDVEEAQVVNLFLENGDVSFIAERKSFQVGIRFSTLQSRNWAWKWLVQLLGHGLDPRVGIEVICKAIDWAMTNDGRQLYDWLAELENIENIYLEDCKNDTLLVEMLSKRKQRGGNIGAVQWPLPRLHTLKMSLGSKDFRKLCDSLVSMVRNRYKPRNQSTGEDPKEIQPDHLRVLEIIGVNEVTEKEIRALLPRTAIRTRLFS